ncbi:MAG: cyclic nucleotide-binding domain-containing protein [Deltaproteobacteria bacterium]
MKRKKHRPRAYRVSPQERMTHLRSAPFFRALPTRDLVPFAELASERSHRRGTAIVERSTAPRGFHVLVEGEAVMRRRRLTVRRVGAGCPIGLLALLAREERDTEVVAVTPALTLSLDAAVFFGLLEERFDAFLHVLRATASQLVYERNVVGLARALRASRSRTNRGVDADDAVDRFIGLRRAAPFGDDGLFGLWHLARRARTVTFERGDRLIAEGEPARTLFVLTDGDVEIDRDGRGLATLGAQDTLSAVELLAQEPRAYGAVANTSGAAIVVDREELFDVFEDHFELGTSFLARISRAVLDLMEARARREDELPSGFDRLS